MYNIDGKFFYEILDDYINFENKNEIFDEFCELIWSSRNERHVFTNYIKFNINSNIDDKYKEVFDNYKNISYIDYKKNCKETDFINLLRQKINNIYSLYCDKRIYLKKQYMDLLKLPKNIYFKVLHKDDDVLSLKIDELNTMLLESIQTAYEIKDKYIKGKILIGWEKYRKLINSFMQKCFDNYIPLSQSENKDAFKYDIDLWVEDNYCIKYFCRSLERYFKNYEKEYFGVRQKKTYKECIKCGGLIEDDSIKDICRLCTGYKKIGVKYLTCCECGIEFEVNGNTKKQIRCDVCKAIKNKEWRMNNYYKNKM